MLIEKQRQARRMKRIMKSAHRVAKDLVARTGSYQIALSFALKAVYAYRKLTEEERIQQGAWNVETYARIMYAPTQVASVPAWFIKEKLHTLSEEVLFHLTKTTQLKETEKAIHVQFDTDNGRGYTDSFKLWAPKSILVA